MAEIGSACVVITKLEKDMALAMTRDARDRLLKPPEVAALSGHHLIISTPRESGRASTYCPVSNC